MKKSLQNAAESLFSRPTSSERIDGCTKLDIVPTMQLLNENASTRYALPADLAPTKRYFLTKLKLWRLMFSSGINIVPAVPSSVHSRESLSNTFRICSDKDVCNRTWRAITRRRAMKNNEKIPEYEISFPLLLGKFWVSSLCLPSATHDFCAEVANSFFFKFYHKKWKP